MERISLRRELPLRGAFDVIVVGGGTAGTLAAVAAQRNGAKTLIVEQFGCLGGSATAGLVTPLMASDIENDRGHCGLSNEITRRMRALGGTEDDDYKFDPTLLKFVLEDMAEGCAVLYHSMVVDCEASEGRIGHIVVANKDGLTAYTAKCFIDATGDADLAVLAGVPFKQGDRRGVNQPVTLRFEMAGIDFERFHAFMRGLGNRQEKYFAMNTPGMREILAKAVADGVLTKQDAVYFQGFGVPGKPDVMNFNCPELETCAGVAAAGFLSQKQIEGKRAILRLRRFLRTYIRGFEKAYITELAPLVGFRESRRIEAEYVMTAEDMLSFRKFDDAVASSCYAVDVHGVEDVTLGLQYDERTPRSERFWQVPFRTMVNRSVVNLLVAGRCSGFDFVAQSAARIQLVCRAMGEAAGVGAALAVREQGEAVSFRELELKKLGEELARFEAASR